MILDRIAWAETSQRVKKQQRNREVYTPTISIFRWWARRSHALFGALLDAAITEFGTSDFTTSDPFSGGGTVGIEADLRGLRMYAQDLQPWAVWGLAAALDRVNHKELLEAGNQVLSRLETLHTELYGTTCPCHGDWKSEVVHTYWVRQGTCPECDQSVYLYPTPMLTYSERVEKEHHEDKTGCFGCRACGAVTRAPRDSNTVVCTACSRPVGSRDGALLNKNHLSCHHCKKTVSLEAVTARPMRWHPVLVQRLCKRGKEQVLHLDLPTENEVIQANHPRDGRLFGALSAPIPVGRETARLHNWGYHSWSDLYPSRQLAVYLAAADEIHQLGDVSDAIKKRLLLLLCGAPEMAGYASRWDRFHGKAFEAMANHRFSATPFAVEVSPLGSRGRGTLSRRLKHSVKAAKWANETRSKGQVSPAQIVEATGATPKLVPAPGSPVVAVGSSETQLLETGSVRLVLTDPPYFDDVQYGELARPFLAWARRVGLCPDDLNVDLTREAVPNEHNRVDGDRYTSILQTVFTECVRTLAPDGRVILTYHNTDILAWVALGRAIAGAGLQIVGLATVHAENETDHAKRNRRAFSKDLVIECVLGKGTTDPIVASVPDDSESLELVAIGKALAANPGADKKVILEDVIARIPRTQRRLIV